MKTIGGVVTGPGQGLNGSSLVHSKPFTCSASTEPSPARTRRVTWLGTGPRMDRNLHVSSSLLPMYQVSG